MSDSKIETALREHQRSLLLLIRLATICVFLGRAWQHLVWEAPYRALLWDEQWMAPVVELFGFTWREWVTGEGVEAGIQAAITGSGVWYLVAALAAALLTRTRRWAQVIVLTGSVLLLFLAALYTKEKFYHLGQFFEYALQVMAPVFLVWLVRSGRLTRGLDRTIRGAIALTFTCHGLYAIGYYPLPGDFLNMTVAIMRPSEEIYARQFLLMAGVLDVVCSVLVLLPWRPAQLAGLAYAVSWGFATAMARIWAYLLLAPLPVVLSQWVYESVYRWPHFLVPLALLLVKGVGRRA